MKRVDPAGQSSRVARASRFALAALATCLLVSCSSIGPRSILAGRSAYTDVINRTEDQQILNTLVRMRYDETFSMLSVSSVTASLKFGASATANFGIGADDAFDTNLVPLETGIVYEENPTISYTPLTGEDFMRRLLLPVPLDEWLLLSRSVRRPGVAFALAFERINGLRNSGYGWPGSDDFNRVAQLFGQLVETDALDVVLIRPEDGEPSFAWALRDDAGPHHDGVREFIGLLGLQPESRDGRFLLNLTEEVGRSSSRVSVQTRSLYDVLKDFSTGVEVPAEHLEAGIAEHLGRTVADDEAILVIRSSKERPDDATVAVPFRDHWYSIAADDGRSKRAFGFIRTYLGVRLADPSRSGNVPVLTIPAG